jgi:hypothetical protein
MALWTRPGKGEIHLSVQSSVTPDTMPLGQLRDRVAAAVHGEKELVLSPSFFTAFARAHGRAPACSGLAGLSGMRAAECGWPVVSTDTPP